MSDLTYRCGGSVGLIARGARPTSRIQQHGEAYGLVQSPVNVVGLADDGESPTMPRHGSPAS